MKNKEDRIVVKLKSAGYIYVWRPSNAVISYMLLGLREPSKGRGRYRSIKWLLIPTEKHLHLSAMLYRPTRVNARQIQSLFVFYRSRALSYNTVRRFTTPATVT